MITKIIHQIWNERKQNAWLFLELIFASIFLWLAIDPLFTLVCRGNLPKGYTPEKVYRVKCDAYNTKKDFLNQLADAFDNIPEIECSFIAQCELQPNPGGYSSSMLAIPDDRPDSLIDWKVAHFYNIRTNEKSRFFETMRAIDVKTGKVLQQADYAGNDGAYLSRRQAMALFGTTDVVGKKFINVYHDSFTILGVFEDLQLLNYDEYTPIVLFCNNVDNFTFGEEIYFRLKDSVDEDEFKKNSRVRLCPSTATASTTLWDCNRTWNASINTTSNTTSPTSTVSMQGWLASRSSVPSWEYSALFGYAPTTAAATLASCAAWEQPKGASACSLLPKR